MTLTPSSRGRLAGLAGEPGGDGAGAAVAGDFPATVEHRFGTTEVADPPERIVTLGYSDQDAVLAFGVAPVAVTDWYGEYAHATWPWAQDELGDAEPTVLDRGQFTGEPTVDFEEVAALEPDLIIALYTGMDEEAYGLLSDIAPTVAPSGDYPTSACPGTRRPAWWGPHWARRSAPRS